MVRLVLMPVLYSGLWRRVLVTDATRATACTSCTCGGDFPLVRTSVQHVGQLDGPPRADNALRSNASGVATGGRTGRTAGEFQRVSDVRRRVVQSLGDVV